MSLTSSEMTPADIAAVTGNNGNNGGNGMWGGDCWWVIILFFIFAWGWGGNGFGGFGGNGGGSAVQGALTRGDLCMDMNFQEVKREVQNANDAVNLGFSNLNSTICNQQYDTARMINGLGTTIQGGFNATNVAMLQGQNALATQIAGCCCDIREQISGVNYNMAQNTCAITNQIQNSTRDIVDATRAGTQAVLAQMCNDKIEALQNENSALRLAASQTAQNQYLVNQLRPCPQPCYLTCSPFQASYGIGLTNNYGNCGCGCGCNG